PPRNSRGATAHRSGASSRTISTRSGSKDSTRNATIGPSSSPIWRPNSAAGMSRPRGSQETLHESGDPALVHTVRAALAADRAGANPPRRAEPGATAAPHPGGLRDDRDDRRRPRLA